LARVEPFAISNIPRVENLRQFTAVLFFIFCAFHSYCGKLIAGGDDEQHEDEFALTVFTCLLASWVCILCGDSVSFKNNDQNRTKQPYILALLAVLCTLVQVWHFLSHSIFVVLAKASSVWCPPRKLLLLLLSLKVVGRSIPVARCKAFFLFLHTCVDDI